MVTLNTYNTPFFRSVLIGKFLTSPARLVGRYGIVSSGLFCLPVLQQSHKVVVDVNLLRSIFPILDAALVDFNPVYEFPQNFGRKFLDVGVLSDDLEKTPHIDRFFAAVGNLCFKGWDAGFQFFLLVLVVP
jgi:hypothetical protein